MEIKDMNLFQEAERILHETYGPAAVFREGQYEAIEATMTRKRVLVVQKTGWGKSLVYFVSTKLKRNHGQGFSLVISPLLVLMDNQIAMAEKMGLHCAALNSSVKDREVRLDIIRQMCENELDMAFITPETLLNDEAVQRRISEFRIGLFVVDEAHCISDWGHDFRLEYSKIGKIIQGMFSNVSVLATTATANDRVVSDLKAQLGEDVYISRGPLTRKSLHIQTINLGKRTERYAWILDNLPRLPGTGIIYCLDRRDCDYLSTFLCDHGVPVMSYYSRDSADEHLNEQALDAFQKNQIKAIVATIKLGMGYDKGDISFVIHFQSPSSIVSWYQQIGRAGRSLSDAYVFLLSGKEDNDINEYFIRTAFPSKKETDDIMELVSHAYGMTKNELYAKINARPSRIDKALTFLENDGFIRNEKINGRRCYFSTAIQYIYREEHYQAISNIRRAEMRQMHDLMTTSQCLSRFAVNCLDDWTAQNCGKCSNCTGQDIYPELSISDDSRQAAVEFVKGKKLEILPRKKYPNGKNIPRDLWLNPGICLSRYGDPGYGEMVARGKYPLPGKIRRFDDQLVAGTASVLQEIIREHQIQHITCVPSLRSDLVREFTIRLAQSLNLVFQDLLVKTEAPQQKDMENSAFQFQNADSSFFAAETVMPEKVILVDDLVDSRWTFTVCGIKLKEKGCSEVFPFALADSSHMED